MASSVAQTQFAMPKWLRFAPCMRRAQNGNSQHKWRRQLWPSWSSSLPDEIAALRRASLSASDAKWSNYYIRPFNLRAANVVGCAWCLPIDWTVIAFRVYSRMAQSITYSVHHRVEAFDHLFNLVSSLNWEMSNDEVSVYILYSLIIIRWSEGMYKSLIRCRGGTPNISIEWTVLELIFTLNNLKLFDLKFHLHLKRPLFALIKIDCDIRMYI